MSLYNAFLKQSNILNAVLVKKKMTSEHEKNSQNAKGVLIKAAYCPDSVHEILRFLLLLHLLYVICVKFFMISMNILKSYTKNKTTYRAGAAVVSTFTSLEALVMHATIQAIWPASRLTCASSGKEFEENFGSGSLHARGLPRTPTSEPARRLQAINLQMVFPSQLRSS